MDDKRILKLAKKKGLRVEEVKRSDGPRILRIHGKGGHIDVCLASAGDARPDAAKFLRQNGLLA